MELSDLPVPEWLSEQERAIWPDLVDVLAERGHVEAVYVFITTVLAGAIVMEVEVRREIEAKGVDPAGTEAWKDMRDHLADVAATCCLTLDDLEPVRACVPPRYPSEHHRRAAELRRELRQIEAEISAAETESDEWIEALERQRWNHFYLIGADLLARIHDERQEELRRMAEEDSDGEQWKQGAGE